MRGKIKQGWEDAGTEFEIIGESVMVGGQLWTPIVNENEDEPTWIKTAAVEVVTNN